MKNLFCLLSFATLICLQTYGQKSKTELENLRKGSLAKIESINQILKKTQQSTTESQTRLNGILQKINHIETLIKTISHEIDYLEKEIEETIDIINAFEKDLDDYKKEYAMMIYLSSKNAGSVDKLQYLFSAETLGQLWSRMESFKQYSERRQTQINQIERVKKILEQKKQDLLQARIEKGQLYETQMKQNAELVELKEQERVLVTTFRIRESNYKKELQERKEEIEKLNELISLAISKEMESYSSASKNTSSSSSSSSVLNSQGFQYNKGKLNWPITGYVSNKFGRHEHPVFKGVIVENLGIDIISEPDASVFSVFSGKVSAVTKIPELNYIVMIEHGEYFTVYAKLKKANVRIGQSVSVGDKIGDVGLNTDGFGELKFQIWKNQAKLNPEDWLSKN